MGFRNGAYATVWEVKPYSETCTKVKISITKKVQGTDEYKKTFSGWVQFQGTIAAPKALKLKEKDRVQLNEVDVENLYNEEKERLYYFFKVWKFDKVDSSPKPEEDKTQPEVDGGEPGEEADGLPF